MNGDPGVEAHRADLWKWLYDNRVKYDIDIINMSWFTGDYIEKKDANGYINLLYASGVFMVASMGNDGSVDQKTFRPHIHSSMGWHRSTMRTEGPGELV